MEFDVQHPLPPWHKLYKGGQRHRSSPVGGVDSDRCGRWTRSLGGMAGLQLRSVWHMYMCGVATWGQYAVGRHMGAEGFVDAGLAWGWAGGGWAMGMGVGAHDLCRGPAQYVRHRCVAKQWRRCDCAACVFGHVDCGRWSLVGECGRCTRWFLGAVGDETGTWERGRTAHCVSE